MQPPAFLLALVSKSDHRKVESHDESCLAADDEEFDAEFANLKPCCRARVLAARQANQPSCCQKQLEKKPTVGLPGIIAIQALKCRGHSLTVSLLPPSLLSGRDLGVEPSPRVVERLVLLDHSYSGIPRAPATPPPRQLV